MLLIVTSKYKSLVGRVSQYTQTIIFSHAHTFTNIKSTKMSENRPPIPALRKKQRIALEKLFAMRLYSKENIAKWVECDKKLRDSSEEVNVDTYDSTGQMHTIKARGPGKQLRYCSYHQVAHPEEEQPASDEAFKGMLVRVTDYKPPMEPVECCDVQKSIVRYDGFERNWMQTKFYSRFMGYVHTYILKMSDVKSVVCFGLGKLMVDEDTYSPDGYHAATTFLQHAATVHIRDMIALAQKKPRASIPIYAQDPAYCSHCKMSLKNRWDIEVMDFNSGFLKADQDTFVVSTCPAAPVRQVVGDLTYHSGMLGPAGMLTEPTHSSGVEAANRVVDVPSPRFHEFVLAATKNELKKHLVSPSENPESSDEESDENNMVYWDETRVSVPGAVFGSLGMYFSKKSK
jgi:hypothetical protein